MTTRPSAPLKKLEKAVVHAAMRWYHMRTPDVVKKQMQLLDACARLAQRKPK